MELEDREKILRNLVQLIQIQNAMLFCAELVQLNVFSPEMIENIQCSKKTPKEQVQQLFLDICKRGPAAFNLVVQALVRTGNVTEAKLLDPTLTFEQVPVAIARHDYGLPTSVSRPMIRQLTNANATENAYKIRGGFALILNVVDFDGNPCLKRIGADADVLSLTKMLRHFGYEVHVAVNPKKKELLCRQTGILKRFTDLFSNRIVDSCVVAIMSHGEENFWIQTSDCERLDDEYAHLVHLWEDIFPRFNNQFLPIMRNKPKLFIVQSCRGERVHRRIRVSPVNNVYHNRIQADSGKRQLTSDKFYEHHPEFNHMMVLQSTLPGYVSIRHEEKGSPFIQVACQIFQQLGKQLTLAEMVAQIAKKLQDLPPIDGGPQTCTFKTVGYVKTFRFAAPDNLSK